MPEYDHEHVMTVAEYFAKLDPFLVVVTIVLVLSILALMHTAMDLVLRAAFKEKP